MFCWLSLGSFYLGIIKSNKNLGKVAFLLEKGHFFRINLSLWELLGALKIIIGASSDF